MTAEDTRLKFAIEMAKELVGSCVEKRMLGGPVVKFGSFLNLCGFAFQTGALLGHAFAREAPNFAVAFSIRSEVAEQGLAHMKSEVLRDLDPVLRGAKSPFHLVCTTEMASMHERGEWPQWLAQHANQKIPADMALQMVVIWGTRGAGLVLRDGDTVVRLIENAYNVDNETLTEMREYGVLTGTDLEDWTLDGAVSEAAEGFLEFVASEYPEYLRALTACRAA